MVKDYLQKWVEAEKALGHDPKARVRRLEYGQVDLNVRRVVPQRSEYFQAVFGLPKMPRH